MSFPDSTALARVVLVLCRRVCDRDSATALVDYPQLSRCRQLLCLGSRLGSRTGESDRVLVYEYRILHSAAADLCTHERSGIPRSKTAAAFLPAVYVVLHRPQPDQDGAVDLGQH